MMKILDKIKYWFDNRDLVLFEPTKIKEILAKTFVYVFSAAVFGACVWAFTNLVIISLWWIIIGAVGTFVVLWALLYLLKIQG
jgi:hypothetical protein